MKFSPFAVKILTSSALLLLLFSACEFRRDKIGNEKDALGSTDGAHAGFEQIRAQVFEPACIQCHSSQQPNLSSYDSVKPAIEAIRQSVFVNHSMPKSGSLSASQSALLSSWIAAGAPEFPVSGPVAPVTQPSAGLITWSDLKKQVINVSCAGCHFAHNPKGISDYTELKTFRASLETIIFTTLLKSRVPMPPPPATLTASQKRLLADWVADGERDENGVPVNSEPGGPDVSPSPSPTVSPSPTLKEYRLVTNSSSNVGIHFEISHFFGTLNGVATRGRGSISIVQNTDGSIQVTGGKIDIPISGLTLDDSERDCHMIEALGLDYSKSSYPGRHICDSNHPLPSTGPDSIAYPEISLELSPVALGPVSIPKGGMDIKTTSRLTIHGVSHDGVVMPLHVDYLGVERRYLRVTGGFNVLLKDYGITVKSTVFGLNVDESIALSLDTLLDTGSSVPGLVDGKATEFSVVPGTQGSGVSFDIGYFAGVHHGVANQIQSSALITLGPSLQLTRAKFSVPIASMTTDNPTRDCHMREALGIDYTHSKFPAEHICDSNDQLPTSGPDSVVFPMIDFEMTGWTSEAGQTSLNPGESIDLKVTMNVSIHGVTQKGVVIPMRATYVDPTRGAVRLVGRFDVSLPKYGVVVKAVLGNFGNTDDHATVNLDLTLMPSNAP